ncbi:MAG TPA: hypothetical protein VHB02_15695 [Acidimicrobiales bacterium]|nr:hypothetical protein [Acidimicrobiales bacterium]
MSGYVPPAGPERYFDPPVETMARADIRAEQEARLLEVLPHAYERSALVRHTWQQAGVHPRDISTLDDFTERAPFLDKDGIRRFAQQTDDPYGGLHPTAAGDLQAVMSTSGTTGTPTLLPIPHGLPVSGLGFNREYWEIGVRPDDFLAVVLFTFRGCGWQSAQRIGAVPIFFDHDPAELARFCRAALERRPTSMFMLSGYLVAMLPSVAEREGLDLVDVFSSFHGVIYGGEPLGARARAAVRSWQVELFDHTALGDVAWAMECREHDGMHYPEDLALVEHLSVDGADPAPDGELGELVVTSLDPLLSPLVRFRSDDLVRLTRRTCGCGRTHGRLWPVGRRGDEVVVDGRTVLPVDVWRAVETVPESEAALFQVVRPARQVDRLRLRIGYDAAARRPTADIAGDLAAAVSAEVGVEPVIELVPNEDLLRLGPPHKIPRVARA